MKNSRRRRNMASARAYGPRAIDRVAARVMRGGPPEVPTPGELREQAAKTSDLVKRKALLTRAKAQETRLTGENAETKARKALERSKWYHEND